MPTPQRQIGNLGEDLACRYLQKKGYKIVQTNYYSRFGEIDIIAEKNDYDGYWLVFVEVKTRTYSNPYIYGYPEELVDYTKQRKMLATANRYMDEKYINPNNWRLDIITVDLNPDSRKAKIRHYENV